MKKTLHHIIFFLLFCICSINAQIQGSLLPTNPQNNPTFFIDSTAQLTFPSVKNKVNFLPLIDKLRVNPKYPIWVKVSDTQAKEDQSLNYMSVGNFDRVEMYVDETPLPKRLLNGRLVENEKRVLKNFPIHFPLKKSDLEKPIYFKVTHSNPLAQEFVQVNFLSEQERNEVLGNELSRQNKETLLTGGLVGLFMIFLFFAIMAFIFTGKMYYTFYALYVLSNLVFLIISAERFANLELLFSSQLSFLTGSEPLLFAIISISYNLFLKKFIAATQKIKWIDQILTGVIIYEILLFFADPFLKDYFDHSYVTYKLHEVGLLPLLFVTIYFLYNIYKTGNRTLKLIAGLLFFLLWICPMLYVLSPLGEQQIFFLNPNMPFHLMMIAELIFFTLILGNEEYQAQIRQEKEKADLKYRLSDVEKSALQAQMNPHFIFNCLNSIQGFVLKSDTKQAAIYLSKFSRLVRHNLNASVAGVLTIKEEADLLHTYLSLEKQRLSASFDFEITLPDDTLAETIVLPPLIIQTFVENAVIHGISQKEKDGMININFIVEEETLLVKIRDNGIGYKAFSKQSKDKKHKSVGMSITKKRLELTGKGEKVSIVDLSDLHEGAQGTEVTVYIERRSISQKESNGGK